MFVGHYDEILPLVWHRVSDTRCQFGLAGQLKCGPEIW